MSRHVLVTGAAGFIGFHVARRLLRDGDRVTGVDNLNDYYDPGLKRDRLVGLDGRDGFQFRRLNLADGDATSRLFADGDFDVVIDMAAQAGVRYSLEHPREYVDSNLVGFMNVLEGELGREAEKNFMPMQPGDLRETWASVDGLREAVGYEPSTPLEEGLEEFVDWYRAYHEASPAP